MVWEISLSKYQQIQPFTVSVTKEGKIEYTSSSLSAGHNF